MDDFEERMREMARRYPRLTLTEAIRAMDGNSGLNIFSQGPGALMERSEWVLEQRDIMDLCELRGKIHAIKEIRARSGMGLKEAKEAVEGALALRDAGHMTQAQRVQLERDEQEAIRSIIGA